jgi:arabinogalactan oligomer / maltooligosaccharide transport system substrate-binding protein
VRKRLRYTGIALIIGAVIALIFISVYAVSGRTEDGVLQGRVLIWHAYTNAEAEALEEMIDRFRNIYPNVTVMQQSFSNLDVLQEEYQNAVSTGLGPDVIIGPSTWIGALAPAGQIARIERQTPEDVWLRYTPSTLETVTYGEGLYAIPLALNTMGLYYNRQVVSNTVATTDALEREAAQGAMVLMSTTFRDALWGVNAYGGRLFSEDTHVVLDQGGFANWLAWLSNLRNYPGVILDNNREALRNRFLQGDAAYYMGYAAELNTTIETLGADNIGVSPLPAGPIGAAQPILETSAFMFSPVSSNNQRKLALELAQFLSNAEQSGALMRRVRSVPANQRVRINPRLNPLVSSFATQARAAIPRQNTPEMDMALQLGSDAYLRVLDGGIPPAEAAVAVTNQINEVMGREIVETPEYACANLGTLRLLHSLEGNAAEALDVLITRFRAICPLIIIDAQYESPAHMASRLASVVPGTGRAFTILGAPDLFQTLLAEEPLIKEMTPYVSTELLQRFQPNALDTLRYQRVLYGLPLFVELDVFYYNRDLVNSPAQTLDELRAQAGQSVPIELDVNFRPAFWGVTAYGGRLFDTENRVILDQNGMAEWLAWLQESRDSFGMALSMDTATLRERFESGQSAYYVGSSRHLSALQDSLGPDTLGVAPAPDGPGGNAVPLLSSHGFFFSQAGSDTQVALAMEFIQFVTNAESQAYLAEAAQVIPVNATVDLPDESPIETLLEIARNAIAPPNTFHMQTVREYGNAYYRRVLDDGENPVEVVVEVTQTINERNGIAPLPTPEPTPAEPDPATTPGTDFAPESPLEAESADEDDTVFEDDVVEDEQVE